ncbi:MAG: amidohydrolase family protein [Bacteroidia bacterium]|nr:amidohydrolase family protein [Bacteroidia bacterium]
MKRIYIFLAAVLFTTAIYSQMVQKSRTGTFALTNAKIYTVTQGEKMGTLLIRDGKIAGIGESVSIPQGTEVIDCKGLTIYPGMIDGGDKLGLQEIQSVELTQDFSELGEVNPHIQALTGVNPNSVLIPVTRVNGVTTVLTVPEGGLFTGTAALINLHGYTPDQMYAGFKAVVLSFPAVGRTGRRDNRTEEEMEEEKKKRLKNLDGVWEKAIVYARIDSLWRAGKGEEPDYYPEMAALAPVVRREAKLLVEVNTAGDIQTAIKWVQERKIDAVFTGVQEGWRVADELAKAQIPVITGPVLESPRRTSDRYDRPYANAGLMFKAGVKVAIRTNDAENVRNLPYHAGFAAAYGMGREEAFKAVTIVPAEIFGVANRMGSLEVGKEANLFVADGDPFETKTQIRYLFIQGWLIPLESRHTLLYDEFLNRTPGVK